MCGIFAAVRRRGRGDIAELAEAALSAARRGPHGWGVVSVGRKGEFSCHAESGVNVPASVARLPIVPDAVAVLGHCRLATSGGHDDIRNIQPIALGGNSWIAHNGVVDNSQAIASLDGLSLVTSVDSEVLGRVANRHGLEAAWLRCGISDSAAIMLSESGLSIAVDGQPMWTTRSSDFAVFGSYPWSDHCERMADGFYAEVL